MMKSTFRSHPSTSHPLPATVASPCLQPWTVTVHVALSWMFVSYAFILLPRFLARSRHNNNNALCCICALLICIIIIIRAVLVHESSTTTTTTITTAIILLSPSCCPFMDVRQLCFYSPSSLSPIKKQSHVPLVTPLATTTVIVLLSFRFLATLSQQQQ